MTPSKFTIRLLALAAIVVYPGLIIFDAITNAWHERRGMRNENWAEAGI